MARVIGAVTRNTNYEVSVKKPLDARSLVKTYEDLLLESNWLNTDGKSIAYNGMIVAVANTSDISKNGLYFLFDKNCTTNLKSPAVTDESNWHKVGETPEIINLINKVSNIDDKLVSLNNKTTDLEIAVLKKLDSGTISHTSDDTKEGVTVEGTSLNIVIDAFTKQETVAKIEEAVADASEDIAKLVVSIDENSKSIAKNTDDIAVINNAIENIIKPKDSDEVSVDEDGTLGIKKINVNKLEQTAGDTLILDGGSAM